jgi:hypothetical protein
MVVLGIVADKTSSNPGDLGLFGPLLGDTNGNRGGKPEL